jgi:predicted house-cleaning noncanonical NTP pyrophosphatase (MazG superfamily)
MQSTNDSLLDLLNNVGDEVKSVKSKEEVANYIELINKLIRELDHTVEKLESMKS